MIPADLKIPAAVLFGALVALVCRWLWRRRFIRISVAMVLACGAVVLLAWPHNVLGWCRDAAGRRLARMLE